MPSCCRLIWKSMWNYYANAGCHHCHMDALFGFLSHSKLSVCILISSTFRSAEGYHETYDHLFIYCFHKSLLIDRIGHLPAVSFLCHCNYHITSRQTRFATRRRHNSSNPRNMSTLAISTFEMQEGLLTRVQATPFPLPRPQIIRQNLSNISRLAHAPSAVRIHLYLFPRNVDNPNFPVTIRARWGEVEKTGRNS